MMKKADIKSKLKTNLPMFVLWLALALILVGIDQITKYLASANLKQTLPEDFIPYIFNLTYVENRGAAWGMFADSRWVFIITSSVAIIGLTAALAFFAREHKMFCISLTLILAGGIGNMIDRICNGFVVDFLQFAFWEDFPVFNGADSYVTVGCVLVLIYIIFFDKKFFRDEKKKAPSIPAEGTDNG